MSDGNESYADTVWQTTIFDYYTLGSFIVLYYDYFLTLGAEVQYFWGRKLSLPTFLFFTPRYLILIGGIPMAMKYFGHWTVHGCIIMQKIFQALLAVSQLFIGANLFLRTYALYDRSRRILVVLLVISAIGIAVAIWSTEAPSTGVSTVNGCVNLFTSDKGIQLSVAWAALLFYDSVIFLLTIYKTIQYWRLSSSPLINIIIRDGSAYWLILAMANLSNLLTYVFAAPVLKGFSTMFGTAIGVTLISRLSMNIQEPATYEYRPNTYFASTFVFNQNAPDVTTDATGTAEANHGRPHRAPRVQFELSPRSSARNAEASSSSGYTTDFTISTATSSGLRSPGDDSV